MLLKPPHLHVRTDKEKKSAFYPFTGEQLSAWKRIAVLLVYALLSVWSPTAILQSSDGYSPFVRQLSDSRILFFLLRKPFVILRFQGHYLRVEMPRFTNDIFHTALHINSLHLYKPSRFAYWRSRRFADGNTRFLPTEYAI